MLYRVEYKGQGYVEQKLDVQIIEFDNKLSTPPM